MRPEVRVICRALLCGVISATWVVAQNAPGLPGPQDRSPRPTTRPMPGGQQGRPQPGGSPPGGQRPGGQRPGSGGAGGRPGPGRGESGRPQPSPRPNPGGHGRPPRPHPGTRPPSRPGGGRPPQWGRPPRDRPPYQFRPGDRDLLRLHYAAHLRYIRRARRPVFITGGYFPYGDIGYLTPLPVGLYGLLPPSPPGYQMGYFDGYVVVYDPLTYFIANVVDLLQ